jgi:3-dehydroquinate synthase
MQVAASRGPYDIVIERDLLGRCGPMIAAVNSGRRAVLVEDEAVSATHAEVVAAHLQSQGWTLSRHPLRAEEHLKQMAAVEGIWAAAAAAGVDRGDLIIAVGGGIVGDVAGFAAATWLRGIDVVQVPTTLLSMVDASIGGKTGVNVPLADVGQLGKNMAGAFWSPNLVLVDADALGTLPVREVRSGLAECAKHAVIGDRALESLLLSEAEALAAGRLDGVDPVIEQAIAVKRAVVQQDERESGARMLLNLGHTFGHAIEPIESLDLTHGEAVSIGMVAASACAAGLNLITREREASIRTLLASLGLPVCLQHTVPVDHLLAAMRHDKKAVAGQLRLVLPSGDGAVVRDDVPMERVASAWHAVQPDAV